MKKLLRKSKRVSGKKKEAELEVSEWDRLMKTFEKPMNAWKPPEKLKVSDWAIKHRKLSPESSAEPGKFTLSRAPYQKEMLDAVNDVEVEKVVFMTSSQVGKSETINNIVGYFMSQDPCPIMPVFPNKEVVAQDWSRDRLTPMIRDTEILQNLVNERRNGNSTFRKTFPGGQIVIAGANSPADLSARPVRIILCDEVDRFPMSSGKEGDPVALAERRSLTFWNRKIILASTPTLEGYSKIESEFLKGTQEKWHKKCPKCGELAILEFSGMKFKHTWTGSETVEVEDIVFRCPMCYKESTEIQWKKTEGAWVKGAPHVRKVRSFNINAFSSPWYPWEDIIKQFLEAKKDPAKLQVVTNTLFGQSFKEKASDVDENMLMDRREQYLATLPDGVLMLTAGVDTQDDRLEYEVVGWGRGSESWGIEKGIILGCPDQQHVWNELHEKLTRTFSFADGIGLRVTYKFVDSGGHFASEVFRFCKKHENERFYAIRGIGGPGYAIIHRPGKSAKEQATILTLGVDEGKSVIMSSISIKERGPKYCHFPINPERGYDQLYFRGLLSEKKTIQKDPRRGGFKISWVRLPGHERNEPLDIRNYALAAKELVKPDWDSLEKALEKAKIVVEPSLTEKPKPVVKKRYGVVKRGESF